MKKKFLCVLSLCIFMFSLTGCVKFNASMDIKKDKSMDFSIIYALDTSIFGDENIIDEDEKSGLENQGFTVTDYVDGDMKGVTLSKEISNIDSISSVSDVEYSLSGIMEDSTDYMFTVKKGFLKNTYTAKFNFDASDSDLNVDSEDTTSDIDDADVFTDEEIDVTEDEVDVTDEEIEVTEDEVDVTDEEIDVTEDENDVTDEDIDIEEDTDLDFSDFSSLMSNMDLSFNVSLPYSAISNNATTTNNDNKNLSWSLASDGASTIEFSFELYNLTNILIVSGGLLLFIIILIAILASRKKKRKKNDDSVDNAYNVVPELSEMNNNVQSFSEQSFNQQLMSQNQGIDTVVEPVNNIQPNQQVPSSDFNSQINNVSPDMFQVNNVQPQVAQNNNRSNVYGQQPIIDGNPQGQGVQSQPVVQPQVEEVVEPVDVFSEPISTPVVDVNPNLVNPQGVQSEPVVDTNNIFNQPTNDGVNQNGNIN